MARRLLFISKYPEIVQEFLDAMEEKDIQIDTASNGIEAAARIKKIEYEVVVTGLSLDVYNGEQIITYLNKSHPNTVCIIYTTTISPTQLHFFINERDVFRVFLRPVDFHKEFFSALEEAFEYYDVRVKNAEDEEEQEVELERRKKEAVQFAHRLDLQKRVQPNMVEYFKRLFGLTLMEYGGNIDAAQIEQIKKLEWETVDLCCEGKDDSKEKLERAEQNIQRIRQVKEKGDTSI